MIAEPTTYRILIVMMMRMIFLLPTSISKILRDTILKLNGAMIIKAQWKMCAKRNMIFT